MFIRTDEEREAYADYYRPLVGLKLGGLLESEWPTLLLSHPKSGQEYEVSASQDPEGNGPGFLFFETDDPNEVGISVEGLVVTDVAVVQDEHEDWISWPTLIVDRPGKSPLKIVISQDPEGNGGGHLHGVPTAQEMAIENGVNIGPRLRDSDLAAEPAILSDASDAGPSL